jgi:Zn-dependent protease/CBS domain-containing protein
MFGTGIGLGRVFGVRIELDGSVILIFLLLLFNLGAGVFPAWHPEWSAALRWTTAGAAAILFLGSILIHELSHALVARAQHIPVRSIRLFLFGGVADIEHEPESPKAEALMAGVGPAVSIGLGILFGLLASALTPLGVDRDPIASIERLSPIATLLLWLGPVNVIVGVFNLLPAFPLDGGRVFRAALWAATSNLRTATRWAARVGQTFGWLLILLGVAMAFGAYVPVLGGGLVQGLWLAFIGWFLNGAAATSYRQLVVRQLLQDVPVARLMRRQRPAELGADEDVGSLVHEHMLGTGEQSLFVRDDAGRVVGVVHASSVRRIPRDAWPITRVGDIATPLSELPMVSPREGAFAALRELGRRDTDELLVADAGQILGFITRNDIARWLELQAEDEVSAGRVRRAAGSI